MLTFVRTKNGNNLTCREVEDREDREVNLLKMPRTVMRRRMNLVVRRNLVP